MDKKLKNNMQTNEIPDNEIDKVVGESHVQIKEANTVTSTGLLSAKTIFAKLAEEEAGIIPKTAVSF